MKKLIITCALISAASVVSFAQNTTGQQTSAGAPQGTTRQAPTVEQAAEMRAKAYQNQLGLSDAQYKGIYAAELDFIKQDQASRANGGRPTAGQTSQLMMGKEQKFKSIMTAEQYSKYEQGKTSPVRPTAAPLNR
jgi:hypothetical protein